MSSPFKPTCLEGKVALITGGGSGIGFGIAKTLGEHGAKVAIMGRRKNYLEDAVTKLKSLGISATYFAGDVRNDADSVAAIEHTVQTFGALSILVNSAAGNFLAFSGDMSVNAFQTVLEIDTVGVFRMCRNSYQHLISAAREHKLNPCVINISATLHYAATWYQTHATAAKAAIDTITRQLALEWGQDGIRVNGIAPGPIADTPGLNKLAGTTIREDIEEVPLGRLGTTTDIGYAAVFLASDAGTYVTGDTLVVDGGQWLWSPPGIKRQDVINVSKNRESKSREMKAKL